MRSAQPTDQELGHAQVWSDEFRRQFDHLAWKTQAREALALLVAKMEGRITETRSERGGLLCLLPNHDGSICSDPITEPIYDYIKDPRALPICQRHWQRIRFLVVEEERLMHEARVREWERERAVRAAGHVYFARIDTVVKIGYSSSNWKARVSGILANGGELLGIVATPDAYGLEQRVHRILAQQRVSERGEWFEDGPRLRRCMELLGTSPP